MRKGFTGLHGIIVQHLDGDPLSGDMFVFIGRRGNLLKCFFWDRTGFVIVSKRLEHGKFRLRSSSTRVELDEQRLNLLLDGIIIGGL